MQDVAHSHARGGLIAGLLLAAGISVTLGLYGRVHTPVYGGLPAFGFSSVAAFKSWLASLVIAFALVQLFTALWLFGRLPGIRRAPAGLGTVHRVSGYIAFVLSLPVAAYCLYGFGFAPSPFTARSLVHSTAGCLFYGAFAAKVLVVHARRTPSWAVPLAGGVLFTAVVVAWLTSALWAFATFGLHR